MHESWLGYCGTTTAVLNQNGTSHVYFFFLKKYLCNQLLYIPSIYSNRISFKVQTFSWALTANEKYIRTLGGFELF